MNARLNVLFATAMLGCLVTAGGADKPNPQKIMSLQITSTAFSEGQPIPAKYSCEGRDISPPLQWTNAPANTKSFALIMDDPDAPVGTWVHWVLYDLPANYDRASGRRGENTIHSRQCEAGIEQLAAPGLWRAVSAARQAASLFLQTLRARRDARPETRPDEEGFAQSDGRPRPRRRAVDGDLSEKMKHRTSNIERPTSNDCHVATLDVHVMFDVRRYSGKISNFLCANFMFSMRRL